MFAGRQSMAEKRERWHERKQHGPCKKLLSRPNLLVAKRDFKQLGEHGVVEHAQRWLHHSTDPVST